MHCSRFVICFRHSAAACIVFHGIEVYSRMHIYLYFCISSVIIHKLYFSHRHYHCKNNRESEKMKQFCRLFFNCAFVFVAVLYSASCTSTFSLHPLTQENTTISFPIELCGKWDFVHKDGSVQHILVQVCKNKEHESTYHVNIIQKDVCIAQLEGNLEKIAGKYYVSLSLAKHRWQTFNLTKVESFFVLPVYVTFHLLPNEENVKVYSITLKKGSQPDCFFKYSPSDVNDLYTGNTENFRSIIKNNKQNCLFTYEGVIKKYKEIVKSE